MRSAAAFLVLTLLAASCLPPAQAASGTPALTRITPNLVLASGNATVTLRATLTNTGSVADGFNLSGWRLADGAEWHLATSPNVTLDPGASAEVQVTARPPATGGTSNLILRACATSARTVCAEASWNVVTPLVLELDVAPEFRLGEAITGEARVTWLDGSPVEGAVVDVREQWRSAGAVNSVVRVVTGEDGKASFGFPNPTSRLPGEHLVGGLAARVAVPSAMDDAIYLVRT